MRDATIVVAAADARFREALAGALGAAGFDLRLAGHEPLPALEAHDVALALIDASLDAVTVVRRARTRAVNVPIWILSAPAPLSERVRGLRAGADDWITKPIAIRELVARIEALLRRWPAQPRGRVVLADLEIDLARRLAWRGSRELDLTRREFDLLVALARERGRVVSRRQLLERVWGCDHEADTNVVDVYAGYLRRKLEASAEPRLLHTRRGVGFYLGGD